MPFDDILDKNRVPPQWTRLRAHRIFAETDLEFGGNLIGFINPGNVNPGIANQFLHTNNLLDVEWKTLSPDNLPNGNLNEILTSGPVEPFWSPNANVIDLIASGIIGLTGDTTISNLLGSPISDSNINTTGSPGANSILVDNGGGQAVWTGNPISFSLKRTLTIPFDSNVNPRVPFLFDNSVYDSSDISYAAGTGIFTIGTTGLYLITFHFRITDINSQIEGVMVVNAVDINQCVISPGSGALPSPPNYFNSNGFSSVESLTIGDDIVFEAGFIGSDDINLLGGGAQPNLIDSGYVSISRIF